MIALIAALPGAILREFSELTLHGPRARQSLAAALAVGIAVVSALVLRLDDPWWAGISAYICTQASQPASLRKGMLRIVGTVAGAGACFVVWRFVAYNPAAVVLLLFATSTIAVLGFLLSQHSYAWFLGGITTSIVALGSIDDPTQVLPFAAFRSAEIVLGTVTALAVARLLFPDESAAPPAAPGWRSLFGPNWYALSHATRTGVAIALVPVVWRQLELPNLTQMAVSIGAVMAVPVLTGHSEQDARAIAQRMAQRVAGCLLGGGFALLMLPLPVSQLFLPWLLVLTGGIWLAMQIQTGRHGVSVVGTQAAVALNLAWVQGAAPPDSLSPAIERIAGMLGAIGLLALVNLLLGPPIDADRPVPET